IDHQTPAGILDFIPSYTSILFLYNSTVTGQAKLEPILTGHWRKSSPQETGISTPAVTIPVVYGDAFGEDLHDVASHCGMSPEEVTARHSGGRYMVGALGFAPGFAYLLGLDPALATPRRSTPRRRIPGGSV